MPPGIGYSFDLGQQFNGHGGPTGGGRSRLSPQQAVKILSLRVPDALPSNAPVNRALLTAPGGSAAGAGGLNSMIQQLIEAFKPSQQTPMGAPGLPSPAPQRPAPVSAPVQDAQPTAPLPSRSINVPPSQAPSPAPRPESQGDVAPFVNAPPLAFNPLEELARQTASGQYSFIPGLTPTAQSADNNDPYGGGGSPYGAQALGEFFTAQPTAMAQGYTPHFTWADNTNRRDYESWMGYDAFNA